MADRSISIFAEDAGQLGDVLRGRDEGGSLIDHGLVNRIGELYPGVDTRLEVRPSTGITGLKAELESGDSPLLADPPDLLILSIASEIDRFTTTERAPETVAAIESDLREVITALKAVGVRTLVCNATTVDHDDPIFTLSGRDAEPYTVSAQRLALLLSGMSRETGISVVDVDRVIAEAGGGKTVEGRLLNRSGCEHVLEEIVRIIEDYGFLDDRPLMDQVGVGAAS